MAYFHINHMSKTLKMLSNVVVILPDFEPEEKKEFPVLYLLHGFSHDCFGWLHNTSIARYASERGIAVVMPSGYNSAYTDMHFGQNYFTYISEELPNFIKSIFPVSSKREDTFVCGNSMGGYGAMKCALSFPDRYGAVVSLSGSLHAEDRILGRSANSGNQCEGIYGCPPQIKPESQDLFVMLRALAKKGGPIPRINLFCSEEDKEYLYRSSVEFKMLCDELGIEASFAGGKGGHTFNYWDPLLPAVLDWFKQC